jgi:hypothetical protein
MSPSTLAPDFTAPSTQGPAPWRRGFNGYGLIVTVLVHLLVLAIVLTWRSRVPPAKPRHTDVSLIVTQDQRRPPEPPVPVPMPEFQPPSLPAVPEPAPIVVIEMPQAAPVAPPVAAPPPASPAPAAVAAAVVAAPASAAASAPGAVGSTKLVEECADAPDRMMVAEVYRLRVGTTSVKEMNRRKPVRTLCMAQLNFAPRYMGLGIPGLDLSEWYGLDIRFTVNVPQDGPREFLLLSDDGAMLYVDDKEVIDNDGLHTPAAVVATVNLTKGIHHLRVRYFQASGNGALMLGWKKPDETDYQPISRRLLGRPPAAAE